MTAVVLSYAAAVLNAAAAVLYGVADKPVTAIIFAVGGALWSFAATLQLQTWQRDRETARLRRQGWLS